MPLGYSTKCVQGRWGQKIENLGTRHFFVLNLRFCLHFATPCTKTPGRTLLHGWSLISINNFMQKDQHAILEIIFQNLEMKYSIFIQLKGPPP